MPNDDRIQEVTRLGLHYNLLTAYTSFVAVDSQVRLINGQATTVKQPLPLPQGVSDYAVGNTSIAKKSISRFMAAPSVIQRESNRKAPGFGSGKVEQYVAQDSVAENKVKQSRLTLKKIIVSSGLSKRSVKQQLEKQLLKINACYGSLVKNRPAINGSVEIEMIIDSSGRLEALKRVDHGKKYRNLEKCIRQYLKKLQFPGPKGANKVMIMVIFVLK
jgi:Ca-activated chloride channel family protein